MKQNQRAAETKGNPPESCTLSFDLLDAQTLVIKIGGSWTLRSKRPDLHSFKEKISQTGIARLLFDTQDVADWDSALLTFLSNLMDYASKKGLTIDQKGLPEGARKLLKMAKAVPSKKEVPKESAAPSFLFRVGAESMDLFRASVASLTFVGDVFYAFLKFSVGQARFRRSDLIRVIQDCGIDALAIVSLISLLVGTDSRFCGGRTVNDVRCADICGQSGGHCHGACHGGRHDRNHHGGPHGSRFRGPAGHHAGE